MNECRSQPDDCEPGDWIPAGLLPDWPQDEGLHAYVLPGQVMVQPLQQLPVAVPVVSWNFRRTEMPDEHGVVSPAWLRES
jgi:hypothetical protein